jgi:hypothetical protein
MGLFSQCPGRRFIDGLTDDYVEEGARILVSAFISAIGAKTVYLRTGISPETRSSVEAETGNSLSGSILASEPRRIEAYAAERGAEVMAARMTQIPMLHGASGGITFGLDEEPVSPSTQWKLVFHRGPLLLLEIEISDGTGFRPSSGWANSLLSSGAAHICWDRKQGYIGKADHLYLFFKRLKLFPYSKGPSDEKAIEAGLDLRRLCRDAWSKRVSDHTALCRLPSWHWRQRRFVRKFDKTLLAEVRPEDFKKVLKAMRIDLDQWLRAAV